MTAVAAVTLTEVNKIYNPASRRPVAAVKNLNMQIEPGEIVGLLGSSGCGKTSTLRMIAGLESISSGEVAINGRVVNRLPAAERNVAMAFEGYALYPPLKVRDNIAFSLLRDKTPKAEAARKVAEIARLLDIEAILDRYPPGLSGGQQQRVSLARALVRGADLHLLDEPMSQLEPQLRAVLRARIKDFLIQRQMTTVFVTHDQTEAVALADRIAVMEDGVLAQFASPDELRDRPADLFVASFIGEPPMNLFRGRLQESDGGLCLAAEDEDGGPAFSLPLPAVAARLGVGPGELVHLGVRPHQMWLEAGPGAATDAGARLNGKVLSRQWLGDQTHLGVEVSGCFLIVVSDGDVQTAVDSAVSVVVPPAALHLFDGSSGKALLHGGDSVTD